MCFFFIVMEMMLEIDWRINDRSTIEWANRMHFYIEISVVFFFFIIFSSLNRCVASDRMQTKQTKIEKSRKTTENQNHKQQWKREKKKETSKTSHKHLTRTQCLKTIYHESPSPHQECLPIQPYSDGDLSLTFLSIDRQWHSITLLFICAAL